MNQTQLGPSSERRDRSLFLSFMVRQSCYLLHLLIVINETNMSFMTLSCCNLQMTTWGGKMDNKCFWSNNPMAPSQTHTKPKFSFSFLGEITYYCHYPLKLLNCKDASLPALI